MFTQLEIGGRRIGPGEPLFVIAEIGLNHGGSVDRALAMVDAAARAGASAVKLQTHSPRESLVPFELDEAAHHAIVARARLHGLAVMATPYSLAAVALLARVDVDAYKIASADLTCRGLIAACAQTGRPLVMSTGMAMLPEITHAVGHAFHAGCRGAALLHCVSAYPVPRGSENLRAITTLGEAFGLPIGLSDHAPSIAAVPIAVALGACLYERHLTLDGDDAAVDRAVSSTPAELAAVVRIAAETATALGHGRKECLPAEKPNLVPSRPGLIASRPRRAGDALASRDIDEGAPFTDNDLFAHRGHYEAA